MRKNQKFNLKDENIVKVGRPWTVIAHVSTYNEAAAKVEEAKEIKNDYDYKIKRYEGDFRVKKRLRSDLVEKKKNKKRK